jgi:hypothetical protein
MTRQEIEQKMDALAREFADDPQPGNPRRDLQTSQQLGEMKKQCS